MKLHMLKFLNHVIKLAKSHVWANYSVKIPCLLSMQERVHKHHRHRPHQWSCKGSSSTWNRAVLAYVSAREIARASIVEVSVLARKCTATAFAFIRKKSGAASAERGVAATWIEVPEYSLLLARRKNGDIG